MKIKIDRLPRMTLEEFADKNDLTIVVKERPSGYRWTSKFYAMFEGPWYVKEGEYFVKGSFGNGDTPEEAIADYAKEISEQTLVYKHSNNDTDIKVPILIEKE